VLQTLFHIPNRIGGVPLFGFGILLAVWAVASLLFLVRLVRRQGFNSDTLGYVVLLAILGLVIRYVLPGLCDEVGLPIRGYGMMLLAGVVSGVALAAWRAGRMGVDVEIVTSLAFWMFLSGIVGARLFYIIEYWDERFRGYPPGQRIVEMINLTKGGLVVYGSLIGVAVALVWFVRSRRLPGLALCDLIAPSMMLGLALGRVGCFCNGCCFGGLCDLPWKASFPWASPPHARHVELGWLPLFGMKFDPDLSTPAVIRSVESGSPAAEAGLAPGDRVLRVNGIAVESAEMAEAWMLSLGKPGQAVALRVLKGSADHSTVDVSWTAPDAPPGSLPIHPTQLYSAINASLLCLVLLAFGPLARRDGQVFALMITLYPLARYVIEIIRTDESSVFGTGLSISQNISLLLLAGAIALWVYTAMQPPRRAWAATA